MRRPVLSFVLIGLTVLTFSVNAQVSINSDGNPPHASAMLDVSSTTKGLLIPRMTTAQRTTLSGIATAGLLVYDTDESKFYLYNGTDWQEISTGNIWKKNSGTIYPSDLDSPVSIGISAPLGRFRVHDPIHRLAKVYITPKAATANDSTMIFMAEDNDATYGMYLLYDGSGDELEIWGRASTTNYGPHIKIARGSGNVALGDTYATGYKLSVDGKIICTELRVNQVSSWPDYVFDQDYVLMPVEKLEEYIVQNGRLPGVPSSGEIESSGMDVGEMQRLMIEKIEELSLYIIQQQKQIRELENRLNALSE